MIPKTRKNILVKLFGEPGREFYLRELIRAVGKGPGGIQRELSNLVESGILTRQKRGGRTYFQANPACPLYPDLKNLILKTEGLSDALRTALVPLEGIDVAFIYGSLVRGEERPDSDVDVAVIGRCSFREVVFALNSVQSRLGREVNPTVYRSAEFRQKAKAGRHFVSSLMREKKLFLIGTEDDLRKLVSKRLAGKAPTDKE